MTEPLATDIAKEIAEREAWSPRLAFWNTVGTAGGFIVGIVSVLLFIVAVFLK